MLMPKRVKYRKQFRGRMRGMAKGGTELLHGDFGLLAKPRVYPPVYFLHQGFHQPRRQERR